MAIEWVNEKDLQEIRDEEKLNPTIEELQERLKSAEETNQYLVLATIELYETIMPEEETA